MNSPLHRISRFVIAAVASAAGPLAFSQSAPQDNWTLERTITGGSSNGVFNQPGAVAVAPDGSIVVADTDNYRIQVFTATGEFVRRFGSQGTGNGQFGSGMYSSGPTSVAVTSDGMVVVADSANRRIEVFQADGTFVRAFGSMGSGDGQFGANNQIRVAATSDGKIAVADSGNNRVQVFGVDGTFVRKFGSEGLSDGQFLSGMRDLAATPDGGLAVADNGRRRVQIFDAAGAFVRKIGGTYGTGDGQFQNIFGVAVLPDGKVCVADNTDNPPNSPRIQIFDSTGAFVRKLGSAGSADGQFYSALGLASNSSGQLIIADTGNNRVQVIGSDGTFVRAFGSYGGATDGFSSSSNGIAVASDGTLFVSDSYNNRIQVFSSGGQFLRFISAAVGGVSSLTPALGGNVIVGYPVSYADILSPTGATVVRLGSTTAGTADGQFGNGSLAAVVDPANGDFYATDAGNSRVQVFDAAGNFIRKFGEAGTGPGQLNSLSGIGLTPEGRVVVFTTSGNNYLQYFTKQGAFSERRSVGIPATSLQAVGADGLLYFSQFTNIVVLSPQLVSVATLAAPNMANGVGAIDPRTGHVYTFDGTNRRVNVWRRGFRTLGANPPKLVPMPAVVATAQRSSSGIIDIDYSVTDGDSPTVNVALAAFKNGSAVVRDLIAVRAANAVETTAANLGAGQITGTVHRVSWDASAAQVQSTNLVFEVFARDDRPGLLDFDFITLPSTPALTISRIPVTNDDLRAVWAWLLLQGDPALSRAGDGEITGPGGAFTTTATQTNWNGSANVTVSSTATTAAGRAWIFAKLGVREATSAEVTTARQATTTGTPNQFTPALTQQMGARPQKVNEWTFDTSTNYGSEAWWVVPVAQ